MATVTKLTALKTDVPECRAVLDRSEVAYIALPEQGEGACARPDRTQLSAFPLAPNTPAITCPVAVGLELWRAQSVTPASREFLGSEVVRIEHMGAFNCRRTRGSGSGGGWSQHATANAIDISAFVLADGPGSCAPFAMMHAAPLPRCSRPISTRLMPIISTLIRATGGLACVAKPA